MRVGKVGRGGRERNTKIPTIETAITKPVMRGHAGGCSCGGDDPIQ